MATIDELLKMKTAKDPYVRIIADILYTSNWMLGRINDMLKPHDLTEPQYNVLRILRGQKGNAMNLYEIQDRMVQKMSNVSRLIDKLLDKGFVLLDKGFVSRSECPANRRRVDIEITPKGLELLASLDPSFTDIFKDISQNLNTEEAAQLVNLLDKLRGD
jgi:DNA-binding MarR family transcriptional regulator